MALNIKDPKVDKLARELAAETGETITQAVGQALRERMNRIVRKKKRRFLKEELDEIVKRFSALPILDDRTPDEIIGYDENGLPK